MINYKIKKEEKITLTDLERDYRLKQIELDFGGQHLEIMKVADLDELLEKVENEDQIPFWAELWPAAIGLTKFILENQAIFAGKQVLELGAGVGLAGIAARLAGAEVVQSDFDSEALRFIRYNTEQNHLAEPELLLADWRKFPVQTPTYDLIIGSDILYEKNLHLNLVEIFCQVLRPGGVVWLSDPGRNYAQEFSKLATFKEWQVEQEQIFITYEGKPYQIDLYTFQKI